MCSGEEHSTLDTRDDDPETCGIDFDQTNA
jgi:hypothetical protein